MAKHGYRAVHPAALEGAAKGVKAVPADESLAGPGAVADEIHAARYGCDGRFRQLQLEPGEEGDDLRPVLRRLVAADAEQNEVIDIPAVVPNAQLVNQFTDRQIPFCCHFFRGFVSLLSVFELEIAHGVGQIHQHPPLLMAHIQIRQRRLFEVPLLPFHHQRIDLVHADANLLREGILLELREVVEVDVHQLGGLDKFAIQFGFGMLSHGL